MNDRMRLRAAIWRYRIRMEAKDIAYGFAHPGNAIRAHVGEITRNARPVRSTLHPSRRNTKFGQK